MFIAHLPAGYLASQFFKNTKSAIACLLGSFMPDLDLLYFYTIGERAVVHHAYPTHMPYFWLGFGGLMFIAISFVWDQRAAVKIVPAFLAGIFLHLCLDSLTGGIQWFAPLNGASLTLVEVTARYEPWYWNFICHWTFVCEIVICLYAARLWIKKAAENRKFGDFFISCKR